MVKASGYPTAQPALASPREHGRTRARRTPAQLTLCATSVLSLTRQVQQPSGDRAVIDVGAPRPLPIRQR